MKILFLSSLYPPNTKGGGELSTHYLAQGLINRGHSVRVFCAGEKQTSLEVEGVPVVHLPLNFVAKPLLERRYARRISLSLKQAIAAAGDFDVIHAHDFRLAQILSELDYPNSIVTARDYAQVCGTTNNILSDGTACTCSWHDVVRTHRVAEASWLRKPFRIWQYKYNLGYRLSSFQKFKHQIFISHAQKREIAKLQNLSGVKTHVIYNPIGSSFLEIPLPAQSESREILFVGTVEMYKGVKLLLEAFHELALKDPNVRLKIVGNGAQKQEYERLVSSWGLQYRVTFMGHVSWNKLVNIYDQAAIVVAPQIWVEPFGRTVVEAMARAKIVISANHGGPAEIIQPNKTGFLFESGSVTNLVTKLLFALKLSDVDRRIIGMAGRQWVMENLLADKIAAQHEAVYRELAEEKLQ